jgi:hypothetical protein
MIQLRDYADDRLLQGCTYCGSPDVTTRDHVPSKCLLEDPLPPNLPVVGSCDECNQKFSKDEEYIACLIESVLCGSTDPQKINRPSVATIMRNSPNLKKRIEASQTEIDGQIAFTPEIERVNNVLLKLARGHAAFELSLPCREKPDQFWFRPLSSLSREEREPFESAHFQHILGEIGSRNIQRLLVTQITLRSDNGELRNVDIFMNDWVDVQDGLYRYIAIHDTGMLTIRIVIAEYLACEVAWNV